MQIINGTVTTYVSFNEDYTNATLSRAKGIVHTVIIPKDKFDMPTLDRIINLDDDSFIGLARIQQRRKELSIED